MRFALNSALAKLGLTAVASPLDSIQLTKSTALLSKEKRTSLQSELSVESSVEMETSAAAPRQAKTASVQFKTTVIEVDECEYEWTEDEEEGEGDNMAEDADEVLRKGAKKVVKKALHLACKRWESMNRRSSIDYLIASTKRLKISSPSPPPVLSEEEKAPLYEEGVVANLPAPHSRLEDTPSPTFCGGHGKKRNRSESHDVMMMKELERFRRTQMGQEKSGERVFAKPRRTAGRGKGPTQDSLSPRLQPQESIGDLISDIHRLSLQRMESESDDCSSLDDEEEDCTVLNAVTKPVNSGSNSEGSASASPMPPPNSPTSLQVTTARFGVNRSPSPLLRNILPLALKEVKEEDEEEDEEERVTCTSPQFQQRISAHFEKAEPMAAAVTLSEEPDHHSFFGMGRDTPVPDMDYFITLHTHPPPGLCQKFLCNNTDEVNLIYHCWLFPDVPFDPEVVCSEQLDMGVFHPEGVVPVHQDLRDAGVAFNQLQPRFFSPTISLHSPHTHTQYLSPHRTVCIHSCHFSPENAQLQLLKGHQLHTFFSAARHATRRVVSLHLVPGDQEVEERLREALKSCHTLTDLLDHLSQVSPSSTDIMRSLILTY